MFTLKLRIDLPRSLFEIIEILKFQKWTRLIYPNCTTTNISFLVIHTIQTLKKHREIGIYRLKPTSHWMATRNFNIKNNETFFFSFYFVDSIAVGKRLICRSRKKIYRLTVVKGGMRSVKVIMGNIHDKLQSISRKFQNNTINDVKQIPSNGANIYKTWW